MALTPTDDRGTPCGRPESLPAGAIVPGIGGGSRHPVLYYALLGVIVGAIAFLWLVVVDPLIARFLGFRTGGYGASGVAIVTGIALDMVLRRRIARGRWTTISRLHLESGRCPACTYALRGLPADADGYLTCPECSAAWRSDRLGTDAESNTD
ncbi:MAG: hypothetical protein DHS20C14_22560 [Phycisphaeraceae bacterium]|nr:MAG: hypothetical protein DHS20C14_22560 [Phycisphaeraceae bacterium]